MRPAACVLAGALLFVSMGCRKPQPSIEYTEASGLYTTLLAKYGDDAYSEPEMDRVEALLAKVPEKSLDAQAAAELKARIAADRKRAEDEARERQRAIDSATAPQPPVDFGSSPPPPELVEPAVAFDAGPREVLQPGMSIEAMRQATDNCFTPSGPLKLRNPDRTETTAEMYERVSSSKCEGRFDKFGSRFLVFKEGKLVGDFDKSALTQMVLPKAPAEPEKPRPPPGAPPPVVEPGGDKPPTPQPMPTSPGENTAPAPVSP